MKPEDKAILEAFYLMLIIIVFFIGLIYVWVTR